MLLGVQEVEEACPVRGPRGEGACPVRGPRGGGILSC